MKTPKSILVVVERTAEPSALLRRSIRLAEPFGARLELFLCDSEQAYVLGHSYDRHGILAARNALDSALCPRAQSNACRKRSSTVSATAGPLCNKRSSPLTRSP